MKRYINAIKLLNKTIFCRTFYLGKTRKLLFILQQQTAGDDYTFSNTVVWSREESSSDSLIDRELILLDFKCIYEDTYSTLSPPLLPEKK